MTYKQYLLSKEWKEKSDECKRLAGYRCSQCVSNKDLQAHHITYDNVAI
jgi:hypothetical protein